MHSIVLLTALTATSGLFGGGRHCRTGHCGAPVRAYHSYAPVSTCQPGTPCAAAYAAPTHVAHQAPVYSAPQAPAPQTAYAPAHQATYYPSFYSVPATSSCATGNCPRR